MIVPAFVAEAFVADDEVVVLAFAASASAVADFASQPLVVAD